MHRELIKDKINCLWRTILITVLSQIPIFRFLRLHVKPGFSYLLPASLLACLKLALWWTALCCGLKLLLIAGNCWYLGKKKHENKSQQTILHGILPREVDSAVLIHKLGNPTVLWGEEVSKYSEHELVVCNFALFFWSEIIRSKE